MDELLPGVTEFQLPCKLKDALEITDCARFPDRNEVMGAEADPCMHVVLTFVFSIIHPLVVIRPIAGGRHLRTAHHERRGTGRAECKATGAWTCSANAQRRFA